MAGQPTDARSGSLTVPCVRRRPPCQAERMAADDDPRPPAAPIRVAVWGTGGVGAIAVQVIAHRPDLELVAVRVHDPAKSGRDAGELIGRAPLGLRTTDTTEDLLAARPDCVCYAAIGAGRDDEVLTEIADLLAAGIDVVTVSLPGLVHPPAF